MDVPIAMGSAEAINFQPRPEAASAAITGDFVLTAQGCNPGAPNPCAKWQIQL